MSATVPRHDVVLKHASAARLRLELLGGLVGLPVRLARACSDPAEWPEDLRAREFPEVRRG